MQVKELRKKPLRKKAAAVQKKILLSAARTTQLKQAQKKPITSLKWEKLSAIRSELPKINLTVLPELQSQRPVSTADRREQISSRDLEELLRMLLEQLPLEAKTSEREVLYEASPWYRSSYTSDYQKYQKPVLASERASPLPWELKREQEESLRIEIREKDDEPRSVGKDMLKKMLKYW